MASYLEDYGAGEERHARRVRLIKGTALAATILLVIGGLIYVGLKNRTEKRQVSAFLEALRKRDYPSAYRMWGCTEATPCRDYSFNRFLQDWGPGSPRADAASAHAGEGESCGTGVVFPVDFAGAEPVALWVERGSRVIGFSPDPECRKRRWHFREFFRSLFGK
jgi:hypothetical protein